MMTDTLYERDAGAIGSLQKLRFFPLAIAGGRGARLVEESGRELIDLSGAWGAARGVVGCGPSAPRSVRSG